jgi:hypothetical protein
MKLLDLLRGAKPATSAQLREALASAEGERADATATLDRLQQRRASLLIDGDDRALDALEADIVQAQRRADRLDLLTIQAEQRLKEAEEAERQAALDATFAEGEQLVAEAVKLVKTSYPPQARKLLQLAERLETIDVTVRELNRRLAASGDPRRLPDYDELARPGEPDDLRWSATSMRQKFHAQVALPSASEWYRLLHPAENAFGRPLRPDEGRPDRRFLPYRFERPPDVHRRCPVPITPAPDHGRARRQRETRPLRAGRAFAQIRPGRLGRRGRADPPRPGRVPRRVRSGHRQVRPGAPRLPGARAGPARVRQARVEAAGERHAGQHHGRLHRPARGRGQPAGAGGLRHAAR